VSVRKEIVLIMICACDKRGFSSVAEMMGEWGWLVVVEVEEEFGGAEAHVVGENIGGDSEWLCRRFCCLPF